MVIALLAIAFGVAIPRMGRLEQRVAVEGAAAAVTRALADARHAAWRRGSRVAVQLDSARDRVVVHAQGDTLATLDLRSLFGVSLSGSRDSLAFALTGLGYGATNTTIALWKGSARDTVWVSRGGRVRR